MTAVLAAVAKLAAGLATLATVAIYRYVSGAVMAKPLGVADTAWWPARIAAGRRGPLLARHVRATARMATLAIAGCAAAWPWPTVATAAVATVATGVAAAAPRLSSRGPIRVRAQLAPPRYSRYSPRRPTL